MYDKYHFSIHNGEYIDINFWDWLNLFQLKSQEKISSRGLNIWFCCWILNSQFISCNSITSSTPIIAALPILQALMGAEWKNALQPIVETIPIRGMWKIIICSPLSPPHSDVCPYFLESNRDAHIVHMCVYVHACIHTHTQPTFYLCIIFSEWENKNQTVAGHLFKKEGGFFF